MKKQILNSIKIITLAALLAVGVSYVSAAPWSAPGTGATGGNTVASVNISEYDQTKIGSFTTNNFFKAGGAFNATGVSWNKPGYAVAEKAFISPWSFFTSAFLPGNTSQVKIGGGDDATTDIFNAARTPFTIDLAGRGTGNNSVSGRQVIDIRTDTIACYPNATIRTNTPAVRLLNSKTGDDADAIVRGVQLSGGNPAPGKILVSTDSDGNAVWGTPTYNVNTGKITFTYGTSPAATGQALCSTPPTSVPGCTNPAATNYNPNATVDNGSCVLPATCPTNQHMSGGVCMCDSTDMAPMDSGDVLYGPLLDPILGYFENDANGCPIPKHKIKTTVCDSALAGVAWSGIPACHQEVEPYSPAVVLIKASQVDAFRYGDAAHAGERSTGCVELRIKDLITNRAQYRYGFHAGQYVPMTPDNSGECFNWVNTGNELQQTRYDIVPI